MPHRSRQAEVTTEISDETMISVSWGALFVVIPLFVGMVAWITNISFTTNANAVEVQNLTSDNKELLKLITEVDRKLTGIKALLEKKLDN